MKFYSYLFILLLSIALVSSAAIPIVKLGISGTSFDNNTATINNSLNLLGYNWNSNPLNNATIARTTDYVPYTGAGSNCDLGANYLLTSNILYTPSLSAGLAGGTINIPSGNTLALTGNSITGVGVLEGTGGTLNMNADPWTLDVGFSAGGTTMYGGVLSTDSGLIYTDGTGILTATTLTDGTCSMTGGTLTGCSGVGIPATNVAFINQTNTFTKNNVFQNITANNISMSGELFVAKNLSVSGARTDLGLVKSLSAVYGLSLSGTYTIPSATGSSGNLYVFSTDSQAQDKGGSLVLGGSYQGTSETKFAGLVGGKENSINGEYGGYLGLFSRTTGAGLVERMRIEASGVVRLIPVTLPTCSSSLVNSIGANATGIYMCNSSCWIGWGRTACG